MQLVVLDDASVKTRAKWQEFKHGAVDSRAVLLSDVPSDAEQIPDAYVAFKAAQPKLLPTTMGDLNISSDAVLAFGENGLDVWHLDRKLATFDGDWWKQTYNSYSLFGQDGKTKEFATLGSQGTVLKKFSFDELNRVLMVERQLVDGGWARTQYIYGDDSDQPSRFFYTIDSILFSSQKDRYEAILTRTLLYYNLDSDRNSIVSLSDKIAR